ncbi:MAG TPA: glycosyltransferase [Solirubrobacteraceae bacterium]|nr:glycosyltransferase [Solirubrobacteraceae bacterium]
MRVQLGCSLGGEGHLVPLANVAKAFERAGHEVVVLVPPALAPSVQQTGLDYRVGDEPSRAFVDGIWERVRQGPPDAVAGLIDRELFAERCTEAMLPAARELRAAWRPDLVVREPCEYASAVVAHESGLPQAQVGISLAALESNVLGMVAPIIDRFLPGLAAAIGSAPYLSAFPDSLDPSPWPDTRRFRPTQVPSDSSVDWISAGDEPLIYVTFGTVLGHLAEAVGVYRCALDAIAGLPARVLMTVGRTTEVADLGSIPDNARVEQWVPQHAILPRAALVVCHGGSGTTMGALATGVPLVMCPLFADQPRNAKAIERAGAGVVLPSGQGALRSLGPEHVAPLRASIERVLGDPAYRRAAEQIAAEIAGMPTLDELVERLL